MAGNYHAGFGKEVRAAMKQAGKSTRRVATETGISQPQVCWLRKGWLPRNLDTFRTFARSVGVDPERMVCFALSYRAILAVQAASKASEPVDMDILYFIGIASASSDEGTG